MPLSDLTSDELRVVHACLECVAAGDVILHDVEFHTIMSIEPAQLQSLLNAWPDVDDSSELVWTAINNAFNNLLGYPHVFQDNWDSRISYARAEVQRVFSKWRGRPVTSYFDGL